MSIKKIKQIKPDEIWWVILSFKSDDIIGHETKKTRPCLVITNCIKAKLITVIPFQSNLEALNLPYTYLVKTSQKNKLRNDSVAVVFQIRSLDQKRFQSRNGIIDHQDLMKIKTLLKDYLKI